MFQLRLSIYQKRIFTSDKYLICNNQKEIRKKIIKKYTDKAIICQMKQLKILTACLMYHGFKIKGIPIMNVFLVFLVLFFTS